jgi:hypothetical protein
MRTLHEILGFLDSLTPYAIGFTIIAAIAILFKKHPAIRAYALFGLFISIAFFGLYTWLACAIVCLEMDTPISIIALISVVGAYLIALGALFRSAPDQAWILVSWLLFIAAIYGYLMWVGKREEVE